MKKITLLLIAFLNIVLHNPCKVTACAYFCYPLEVKGQNIINYSDFLSHKYYLLVTNTVGATTPSNAAAVLIISKDTTWLPLPSIKFPGVTSGSTVIGPSSKMFSLDGNKMLGATDFSLITLPYSQVSGVPYIPMAYTLTAADIYSKLTYTPYNSINPNSYISSYTESDPLFDSKFAAKSTANLSEGSNLYFTTSRTRTSVSGSTGISYNSATGVITNSLPDQTVSIAPSSTNITIGGTYPTFTVGNSAPDQVVSLTAGSNDIIITGAYPNFTVTPYAATTFSVTRAINSSTFQPSVSRRVSVIYNISITCTASIGSNASGTVLLQYSLNGGSTWLNGPEIKNSNTVSLAIALNSINVQEGIVSLNNVPAGAIFKLVPTLAGTATISYISGFETY